MPKICVILPESLHQEVLLTMQKMELNNVSNTVRTLLDSATKSPRTELNYKAQKKILEHSVATYYLVQEHILHPEENAAKLNNTAHDKAQKAIQEILEQ